ncbi:mevalonate kinase [Parendozoicomonas sp. Alg238-R29]|uniref:mevalonate kinase family protein n=1 Tax=Parendozoicomonas sp. Alg238-R29 TaxID=2993446 RepID=UPI00248EE0B6|nr:mevalonate kinase [Parendozoicomonas sp. Alg238-R29]
MRAIAPGKIIISGEHAVVYGTPALAVAVNIHAHCEVRPVNDAVVHFYLDNYGRLAECTISDLESLRLTIDEAYQAYLLGQRDISSVLARPGDLYLYAIAGLFSAHDIPRDQGFEIHLKSDIPMRSGMGSSAATVASVLAAVAGYFHVELDKMALFRFTSHTERLQHGCNSTIDPMVTVHGGLVRMENAQVETRQELPELNWYLVNSGEPEVSTGQCVAEVRRRFGKSTIWNEFHSIITGLEQAFLCRDVGALKEYVKRNHQLLVDIGVVPGTVQRFMEDLRSRYNAVGKVSGAGAVYGEKAGFLLVQSDQPVTDLCREYGFPVTRLQCDPHGVRLC